ncbi:hypothetical protein [Cellulomonas marina]|uniref:Uncharacterized protein n=1 Tax=Cellulomonas marina TaxID=988821 RepID=A0A1I0W4J8_9CELL|nr:hypothetical protein [Cellulomonas marina]GIG29947.1 hypothetical protein Cma02nite_25470 [Cellulomonas marina]SFA82796.1 hypothetical protein SAMN05421867_102130 [Cellulomonas marina]
MTQAQGGQAEQAAQEPTTTGRYAERQRAAAAELHKTGTPDYDPRSHERAVEATRKAQDAARRGEVEPGD